uniref:Uncharacterized protein n=1 Tax=Rangifer tarandus platyrhynchus TaxID=3082113 RepID=A0ACB0EPJ0_RANTA|nr:unnamed protein product [Rangifer tarandus platyrhynchus]
MGYSTSKDACKPITGATGTGPLQPWPECANPTPTLTPMTLLPGISFCQLQLCPSVDHREMIPYVLLLLGSLIHSVMTETLPPHSHPCLSSRLDIQNPKEYGPHIMWDSQVAEHFKNGRRHFALYPLLKSLQVRLGQVRKLGIHLGAGPELDHFYNVPLA